MPDALISIVIPCRNEAANLPLLIDEIEAAMAGRDFEIIIVNDGRPTIPVRCLRRDVNVRSRFAKSGTKNPPGRAFRCARAPGRRAAPSSPRSMAMARTIRNTFRCWSMPCVRPARISAPRKASASNAATARSSSGVALRQLAERPILHDDTRDTGCGLKAVHADILRKLPFFDGTHRFVPALVIQEGYRVVHCDVVDRSRRHGKSNYGIFDRGLQGALDLAGVWWLRRRRRRMPKVEEISRG